MRLILRFLYACVLISACRLQRSPEPPPTWNYNDPSNGGFEKVPYTLQELPPGCVFVEGGIFDLVNHDGIGTKDTVDTFIISRYEETNLQYRSYLRFLKRYGLADKYAKALPDTLFWKNEGLTEQEKDFLVKNYLRSPAFDNYPVLGLTVSQVMGYARWKTDRLNEMILVREGILYPDTGGSDTNNIFSTEAYLRGTFPPPEHLLVPQLNPTSSERPVRMEDGILMPRLRLPTLREWEVAALDQGDSNYTYPVSKPFLVTKDIRKQKQFDFFFVKKKQPAEIAILYTLGQIGLRPVNEVPGGNYGILGLNSNCSEFVLPEGKSIIIGGSWKKGKSSYGVRYNIKSGKYEAPGTFQPEKQDLQFHSSYTGFRLAMDVIGYPYPLIGKPPFKRKKGKI